MVEDDDAVGDLHRLLLVVRDEHGRDVDLVVQAPQPLAQLGADVGVERAERLVEQQDLGLDGQRAGERHALALAAGELGRVARLVAVEADDLQQLVDLRRDLGLRPLADAQAEGDVVAHGHVLERGVVLEDEADAALLRRHAGRVAAGDLDGARSSGASSPAMTRSSVDLPEPLGPSSAVSEPSSTSSETSSRARKSPKRFVTSVTAITTGPSGVGAWSSRAGSPAR